MAWDDGLAGGGFEGDSFEDPDDVILTGDSTRPLKGASSVAEQEARRAALIPQRNPNRIRIKDIGFIEKNMKASAWTNGF